MKLKYFTVLLIPFFILAGGFLYYYEVYFAKYKGMTFIPEQSDNVPLYDGLEPDGNRVYIIAGNHWKEIISFYQTELQKTGWNEVYVQSSESPYEDGAGFISAWEKDGQEWGLSIQAGYYEQTNQTEVLFDKSDKWISSVWYQEIPESICINEQPERGQECFELTDQAAITQIIELINGAMDWNEEQVPYSGKSEIYIDSGALKIFYNLEKGIYIVSDQGTKWMKPEKEFFELTRISKEY